MHRVIPRWLKSSSIPNKNLLTKILLTVAAALGLAGGLTLAVASADGTLGWTGQGVSNGVLNTSECDANNTPYILWVFTLGGPNTVSSATLKLGGSGSGSFAMSGTGNELKATTPYTDLTTLTASVTYVGNLGNGNPNLVISHGCAALTAKVTLTKTYEQGVFTQAADGACFTLAPAVGSSTATQCSNTPEWDGLPVGDYTVTESTTPAGYATISPVSFIVRNDCTALANCVKTGNATATSVGTFENMLLPGHLQVTKLRGPAPGTAWNGPTVTFYVCANGSSATEQTPAQCNSASAVQTLSATAANPVATSGALAEGYYTVCEAALNGYTATDQCQVVAVHAGSVASDNALTFINTPILYWCSPGFWATALSQNRTAVLNYLYTHTGSGLNLKTTYYSVVVGGAQLKKGTPSTVTLAQVLGSPSTYGGPAFNSVADYISSRLGWGGTQLTGENCPLSAQGVFTPNVSVL